MRAPAAPPPPLDPPLYLSSGLSGDGGVKCYLLNMCLLHSNNLEVGPRSSGTPVLVFLVLFVNMSLCPPDYSKNNLH